MFPVFLYGAVTWTTKTEDEDIQKNAKGIVDRKEDNKSVLNS